MTTKKEIQTILLGKWVTLVHQVLAHNKLIKQVLLGF